ncbi:phage minor head protein [Allorhizobium ampelinum]|uniref:phage head morphogenesis protein n=1 Tax=Allorhizobium ampelinum TaxID=3025782 RepID=UPI001F45CF78
MIPPAFSSLSTRRLNTIRTAIEAAPDYPDAARAILTLGAKWTPDALGKLLGDGLELAALHGREAAFTDGEDDDARFADADVFNQPFKEQIDFFTQKRGKPTKAWTDALRGTHDRAFVIAGATDLAMLSDFQTAIASAMQNGTTFADFQKDFDRIVAKYGWAYKGEGGWRSRVIFETNLRTSHMAGRLKQMRDPDVLKLRPYWEYRHGETRKPKIPRTQHLAWHGKCYPHDDPFWQTHFPPNDWLVPAVCARATCRRPPMMRLSPMTSGAMTRSWLMSPKRATIFRCPPLLTISLLGDVTIRKKHTTFSSAITIRGMDGVNDPKRVLRTVSFSPTASNSPNIYGNSYPAGVELQSRVGLRLDYVSLIIPDTPSTVTNTNVFGVHYGMAFIMTYGTLSAEKATTSAVLFQPWWAAPLEVWCSNVAIADSARGHIPFGYRGKRQSPRHRQLSLQSDSIVRF